MVAKTVQLVMLYYYLLEPYCGTITGPGLPVLKHCEMLSKAVISTFGKTKDHGKLLAICFLQKTLTVF